jgi:dihydrofolate synthase/folylpolyglutamate synthase
MTTLPASIQKLYSHQQFGVKLGLENIKRFLERIGNPHKSLKIFHIAGSNGKGSVAAFLASMLTESGFSCGLYTSPHFIHFNERIKISGAEISDDRVESFIADHWEYVIQQKLTFFEVTTALAYQYFAERNVDYAVIETGLGGRLDATNTAEPIAAIITSISLEHTEVLGDTLAQIAGEKAGIIKQGCKVFTGKLPADAMRVIREKATSVNADLFPLEDAIDEIDGKVIIHLSADDKISVVSPLRGYYQKLNGALAANAFYHCVDSPKVDAVSRGIQNVNTNTNFQGRFEILQEHPGILLDSAHNPESMASFLNEFKNYASTYRRKKALYASMKEKDSAGILSMLHGIFDEVYVTTVPYERACTIERLLEESKISGCSSIAVNDPVNFYEEFMNNADNSDCLVITGSMYLLGMIKAHIQNKTINII